ncbi:MULTISPECIES: polyprenyl synthetase family protein [unclassified Streptomyces]|uniref:polyprenyl synthetase family protein n=1 Tax=unclassified Streptomyces TaxID=2593676 RepID=UPI003650BAD7
METSTVDLVGVRRRIDACLAAFLDRKAGEAAAGGLPREVVEALRGLLAAGGKRVRPLLCVVGWHAAGGWSGEESAVAAAASLEMFHAAALIHDDIMDDSATRRGKPTVHRALTDYHCGHRDAGRLGVHAAILMGDLALSWSAELLHTAGLEPSRLLAALPVVDAMRGEIIYGQYLDVVATGHPSGDVEGALEIVRLKTARYTVQRPLQLGAVLAGAGTATLEALTAYAMPVGESFQLRDDLLGVFGDPRRSGKSCLEDLRAGKHTVLLAVALTRAGDSERRELLSLVGHAGLDENGATRVRALLETTGARDIVEDLIALRRRQALDALDKAAFPARADAALRHITDNATHRTA